MKSCPRCGRDYDVTMNFCLDDGSELLYFPSKDRAAAVADSRPLGEAVTTVLPNIARADDVGAGIENSSTSVASSSHDGFWIAVLPFRNPSSQEDLELLAEGLSEEVVTGLSRFSYLHVIARGATFRYAGGTGDARLIGRELGARYVMEGSLRRAGAKVRIAVQLVDSATGIQLWAETYEREIDPERFFELQDDVVPRIVSTVADWYGVLPKSMSEEIRARPPESLNPYEALLFFFGYNLRVTADDHMAARIALEQAVTTDPGDANCWAMLANIYLDEYKFGYNVRSNPLERALSAASKAVELDPSNPASNCQLAHVCFFRREFAAFREAAERAIELNPFDGAVIGYMGVLLGCSGDWERGCGLAEKAMSLNPHHPGWFWGAFLNRAYLIEKDYHRALSYALKPNLPGFYYFHLNLAAIYGQLGDEELAKRSVQRLLELKPNIADTVREDVGMWLGPEFVEQWIEGLRKAGLGIPRCVNG